MTVNEKRSDIAILKTMGASKWTLRFIFIVQGAFNSFVGCQLGAVSGVYIALNLTAIIQFIEKMAVINFYPGISTLSIFYPQSWITDRLL